MTVTLSSVQRAPTTARFEALTTLLCDADGTLFDSEAPAFEASAGVTNGMLRSLGVAAAYTPQELRLSTTGKNFRATAVDLCHLHGVDVVDRAASDRPVLTPELLEEWVRIEQRTVAAHLATALRPDEAVNSALAGLARHYRLAAVSSSHTMRLDTCFRATGMAERFPTGVVFSAEDSLPTPRSKPDPSVYALAGQRMGCAGPTGLALEDSPTGAESAVAAGFPVIGMLHFVPAAERYDRHAALTAAGAVEVVDSWQALTHLLSPDAAVKE